MEDSFGVVITDGHPSLPFLTEGVIDRRPLAWKRQGKNLYASSFVVEVRRGNQSFTNKHQPMLLLMGGVIIHRHPPLLILF